MEIAVTGKCMLSSSGETAIALCENSVLGKAAKQQINLQLYEKEIASLNTGSRELYRIQKILLIAFLRALRMAGLEAELRSPERVGIFLGNSYGIEEFKTEFFHLYKKSDLTLTSPTLFPFTTANSLASWLAIQAGAKGPSLTFVSGSTSSSEAILAACEALATNECDIACVGGVSIIDNNLSDEFYISGFRYESAGMLVLERMDNAKFSKKASIAVLKDQQSITLSQEQIEKIRNKISISSAINEKLNRFNKDYAEITYLGNNLGDDIFSYGEGRSPVIKKDDRALLLSNIVGNVFDCAGVLGVALSVDLLNLSDNAKWQPFDSSQKNILCSNVSSSGAAVTMLVSKA